MPPFDGHKCLKQTLCLLIISNLFTLMTYMSLLIALPVKEPQQQDISPFEFQEMGSRKLSSASDTTASDTVSLWNSQSLGSSIDHYNDIRLKLKQKLKIELDIDLLIGLDMNAAEYIASDSWTTRYTNNALIKSIEEGKSIEKSLIAVYHSVRE